MFGSSFDQIVHPHLPPGTHLPVNRVEVVENVIKSFCVLDFLNQVGVDENASNPRFFEFVLQSNAPAAPRPQDSHPKFQNLPEIVVVRRPPIQKRILDKSPASMGTCMMNRSPVNPNRRRH